MRHVYAPRRGPLVGGRSVKARVLAITAAGLAVAGAAIVALLPAGSAGSRSGRDARWQADIAYLARQLPLVHVGGVTGAGPRAWTAAASRLEAQVPDLTDGQVVVGVMRMVALLRDDETTVSLSGASASLVYPLGLQWIGQRLYLIAVPQSQRRLLGAELEAIDRQPVETVLARVRPEIDYQDPGVLAAAETQAIINPYLLEWLGITHSMRSALFTVRTTGGHVVTAQLGALSAGTMPWVRAMTRAAQADAGSHTQMTYYPADLLRLTADGSADLAHIPLPLYQQNLTLPYWMKVLSASRAVYLKYNGCIDTDGFQRLAALALGVLRQHPAYRLIIDLRDNPGGDSQPFQALVNGIDADPAINRRGRIFGLINQLTDSSANLDAESLSQETQAIMIGQPAEDPIDEYGDNGYVLRLPYFGISVQYTTAIVNGSMARNGMPDVYVAPTVRQVLAGQDPVLQAALDYGQRRLGLRAKHHS